MRGTQGVPAVGRVVGLLQTDIFRHASSGTVVVPNRTDEAMNSAAALRLLAEQVDAETSVAEQIEDFLSGRSNGEALFQALYGEVDENEEIPASMLALVRGG
jgi:hypothetical protein